MTWDSTCTACIYPILNQQSLRALNSYCFNNESCLFPECWTLLGDARISAWGVSLQCACNNGPRVLLTCGGCSVVELKSWRLQHPQPIKPLLSAATAANRTGNTAHRVMSRNRMLIWFNEHLKIKPGVWTTPSRLPTELLSFCKCCQFREGLLEV